jgi:hypothetical protein
MGVKISLLWPRSTLVELTQNAITSIKSIKSRENLGLGCIKISSQLIFHQNRQNKSYISLVKSSTYLFNTCTLYLTHNYKTFWDFWETRVLNLDVKEVENHRQTGIFKICSVDKLYEAYQIQCLQSYMIWASHIFIF